MSDLIDRQAALDCFHEWVDKHGNVVYQPDDMPEYMAIKALPSAEPKKGKWIPHCEMSREYFGTVLVNVEYEYWFCDACGYRVEKGQPMYNFCPNCGARMEG